jgi:hypothetical protein
VHEALARMLHLLTTQAAYCRLHGAGSIADLQEAMPPTRTHLFGCVPFGGFFLPARNAVGDQHSGV